MTIFFKEGIRWVYGLFGATIFFSALAYVIFRSERAGFIFSLSLSGVFYFLLMQFLTAWMALPEKWRLSLSLFFPFFILILLSSSQWKTKAVMPLASVRAADFWYLPGAWVREFALGGIRQGLARWRFSPEFDLETYYRNPDADLRFLDAALDAQGRLLLLVEIDNREANRRFLKLYRLFSDGRPDPDFDLNNKAISSRVSNLLLGVQGEIFLYSPAQEGRNELTLLVFQKDGGGVSSHVISQENKGIIKLGFSFQGELYGLELSSELDSESLEYSLVRIELLPEGNLKLNRVISLNGDDWDSLLGNRWKVLDFYFDHSEKIRWFVLKQGERVVDYLLESQRDGKSLRILGSQQVPGPFPELYEPHFLEDGSVFLIYRDPLLGSLGGVEMISVSGKLEENFLNHKLSLALKKRLLNVFPLGDDTFFAEFDADNLLLSHFPKPTSEGGRSRMGLLNEPGQWTPFYAESLLKK